MVKRRRIKIAPKKIHLGIKTAAIVAAKKNVRHR